MQSKLNQFQRIACLGITNAFRTTPTAVMKIMLNIPSMHILLEEYARPTVYKFYTSEYHDEHCVIWRRQTLENPFLFTPSNVFSKRVITERPLIINTPCREDASTLGSSQSTVFYTYGSLIDGQAGAGIYCEKLQVEHYSTWQHL